MRLKEIEARLAEIKEELNTRAAELTDEEITKLETEVTDLQEERTALLAAAEKRKKLLERIAAGEPTGGAGADATLLRNFKGAGGAGAGEPEDKYDTTAYRKAFMNYVCRGVAIPAEYRAAETTTTADSGAVIPTTIMNEIIQKLESYGSIYAKVRKINVQGGVSIPIADLKPTAHWITEAKSSDDQKASAKNSVTFNYYGLECKISQSILANVVTLKMFTDLFVPMATEASHTTHLKCAYLYQQNTTQRRKCPKRTPTAQKVGCKAVEWLDELTLIAETTAENRVNKNGFAVKPEESPRTVFCNKKSVGYSEYFKSQQTGKLVEAKYEVHKADYGGEDVVEVNGRRYFVLKTYDTGTDTIELTLTDLRHRNEV